MRQSFRNSFVFVSLLLLPAQGAAQVPACSGIFTRFSWRAVPALPNYIQFKSQVLDAKPHYATLWDVFGKNLWQQAVSGQDFEVPLTGFAPGIYLLRVATERAWVTKKLAVVAQ